MKGKIKREVCGEDACHRIVRSVFEPFTLIFTYKQRSEVHKTSIIILCSLSCIDIELVISVFLVHFFYIFDNCSVQLSV